CSVTVVVTTLWPAPIRTGSGTPSVPTWPAPAYGSRSCSASWGTPIKAPRCATSSSHLPISPTTTGGLAKRSSVGTGYAADEAAAQAAAVHPALPADWRESSSALTRLLAPSLARPETADAGRAHA